MIFGAAILTGEAVVDPDKPKSVAFDVKFWVCKGVSMPVTARLRYVPSATRLQHFHVPQL